MQHACIEKIKERLIYWYGWYIVTSKYKLPILHRENGEKKGALRYGKLSTSRWGWCKQNTQKKSNLKVEKKKMQKNPVFSINRTNIDGARALFTKKNLKRCLDPVCIQHIFFACRLYKTISNTYVLNAYTDSDNENRAEKKASILRGGWFTLRNEMHHHHHCTKR